MKKYDWYSFGKTAKTFVLLTLAVVRDSIENIYIIVSQIRFIEFWDEYFQLFHYKIKFNVDCLSTVW